MSTRNKNNFYYDPYYFGGANEGKYEDEVGGGSNNVTGALNLKNNKGIFGIPYQFLPSVDRRINSDSSLDYAGRKYAEKIMGRLPLLFLVPCRQQFMEGYSSEDRGNVINALIHGGALNVSKSGRYYDLEYRYDQYYNIVNRMGTVISHYMGIGDTSISKGKIANLAWQNMNSDAFKNYFMVKEAVVFYADGMTSISDSFSNSTTESSLASSLNGFSDQAKEVRFLLGDKSALVSAFDATSETAMNLLQNTSIPDLATSLTNGMIGDLATTGVSTVLSGGKLLFPKIWGDSQFSRSYTFDIKLRSPDHDTLSIFLNVIMPYVHLLALALPRSISEGMAKAHQNPNGYSSPFLVRAYAKGMFNINMGIITELSATRGKECEWNVDGLPTQIDVSITIEDMYSTLFVTDPYSDEQLLGMANNWDLVTNTEMMDFLANLSGLNVATQVNNRKAKYLTYLTSATAARMPATIYTYFENGVSNKLRKLWDILN